MDIEAFWQRGKMLELREALIAVEEERLIGHTGSTPDELEVYLTASTEAQIREKN